MSRICETTLRVRYAETDQMAVVYHSNYIIWFEVGRTEMLRQLGLSYREMEEDGMVLPVVEVKCRYKHPARYDDEITIRTWVAQMELRCCAFSTRWCANPTGGCWPRARAYMWWWGAT